ncbi:MAG: hypothetical protein JXQ71_07025 [Verrucomicrobia bacterium]|nr:hypothetical protein [Verrucomicrobiota bacterium]
MKRGILHAGPGAVRAFLMTACALLSFSAVAKLGTVLGGGSVLAARDAVLGVAYGGLLPAVGGAELLLAVAWVLGLSDRAALCGVAWLATAFLLYRVGAHVAGAGASCPCLGTLPDALHGMPGAARWFTRLSLAFMLLGSYGLLLGSRARLGKPWGRRGRRTSASGLMGLAVAAVLGGPQAAGGAGEGGGKRGDSGVSGRVFEVRGQSRHEYVSKGGWRLGDSNAFEVAVGPGAWRLTLRIPGQVPDKATHVGEDGTNYYVLAEGSAGTCRVKGRLAEYADSAVLWAAGSMYPRHHGTAVWLLFASADRMSASVGEMNPVFAEAPASVRMGYERVMDWARNAFGPARVRIYVKTGLGLAGARRVAELEVVRWRREAGGAIPVEAEYRLLDGGEEAKVMSIYRLWGMSRVAAAEGGPRPARPPLRHATLMADHRLSSSVEYVAMEWPTQAETRRRVASDEVRFHRPPGVRRPRSFVLGAFLALVTLAGAILGRMAVSTHEPQTNEESNQEHP